MCTVLVGVPVSYLASMYQHMYHNLKTKRETDRQTNRNRETDREIDRERERQRERDTHTGMHTHRHAYTLKRGSYPPDRAQTDIMTVRSAQRADPNQLYPGTRQRAAERKCYAKTDKY